MKNINVRELALFVFLICFGFVVSSCSDDDNNSDVKTFKCVKTSFGLKATGNGCKSLDVAGKITNADETKYFANTSLLDNQTLYMQDVKTLPTEYNVEFNASANSKFNFEDNTVYSANIVFYYSIKIFNANDEVIRMEEGETPIFSGTGITKENVEQLAAQLASKYKFTLKQTAGNYTIETKAE